MSYKILLVQRNIYICALTLFVTLTLNIYIILFRRIYKNRDAFELMKSKLTESRASSAATTTPTEPAKIY